MSYSVVPTFGPKLSFAGLASALVRDSRDMIEPYILGYLTSSCSNTAMMLLLLYNRVSFKEGG